MPDPVLPQWVESHGLEIGSYYYTNDSDLALEYVGCANVRDSAGFRIVMVFREMGSSGPMLTLNEADADACAGFRRLGDRFIDDFHDHPD